jgi:hypothetical protein
VDVIDAGERFGGVGSNDLQRNGVVVRLRDDLSASDDQALTRGVILAEIGETLLELACRNGFVGRQFGQNLLARTASPTVTFGTAAKRARTLGSSRVSLAISGLTGPPRELTALV